MGAVAEDVGGGLGGFGSDADAGVDAMAEEALDVGNDLAHVGGFFLQRAAAGVAEELFNEFGGSGGGLAGTFQASFDFGLVTVGGEFGEGDVAVDGGEEIVEVVGDAAGDQAQGPHFLGFAELAFEQGDFGVVAKDPDLADDGAGLRDHGEGLEFDLNGGIEGQFAGQLTAFVWSGGEFFEPGFFVLFGDQALFEEGCETFAVATDEAFEGFAEEGVEFFIGGDDRAMSVDDDHAFVTGGEEALHGAEGFANEAFGVLEALGSLAGVFFSGGEGLMLLGEEEVDLGADFEEGFGEPGGGFVFGRETFEEAAGAVDSGFGGTENPVTDQIGGQEDAAAEEDSGITEEPSKGLSHHFGGSHGREETEEPEGTEEAEARGVHRKGGGRE